MSKIVSVKAREIMDSRGNPTVEVSSPFPQRLKMKAGGFGVWTALRLERRRGRAERQAVLRGVSNSLYVTFAAPQVDLCTERGMFRAAVPSGASTGVYGRRRAGSTGTTRLGRTRSRCRSLRRTAFRPSPRCACRSCRPGASRSTF